MKFIIKESQRDFNPFRISIRIETIEEYKALMELHETLLSSEDSVHFSDELREFIELLEDVLNDKNN